MQNIKKSVIVVLTIFMMCVQCFFPLLQSFATEEVNVSVMPSPIIDIVLAKSKTKVDVTTFENDIKEALLNQNISPDRVKVSAVEATVANIQESFSWQTDVSSSIGSIAITNNGQNVVMKGNQTTAGKNAIWIMPSKAQDQEFNFGYSVDFGDSFNAAGMLLRVKQSGNTLTGYMLSFNKSGQTWYTAAGSKYGAIWKFTYVIGANTTNMTKTLVQSLDISTSGTLNVKVTDTDIIISGGGLSSEVDYVMDTEYGPGFGFFSDHYSHNCTNIGAFTLSDINLTTTTVKEFKEVLSNPEWREGSLRFLVNVDDNENEELQDSSALASLQTRLINEQINYVFWGTSKNEAQANEVIKLNNNNGIFINNSDYTSSINSTAQYIKSLINSVESSEYVLLNEDVNITVTPESAKSNTQTDEYPYGKWKILHDYEYFENNLGQFANSGKYMPDFTMSFDKTGRYELLYADQNITPKYIYVHRKPVADFSVARNASNVTLTSISYDLDSYSNNNGISEEEWKYKKVGETTWTDGKLTTLGLDEIYVIQLRVKDFQETWSNPITKYITYTTTVTESTPIASFSIKSATITKYENLEIVDSSYDPAGLDITNEVWTVKKDGTVIYTGSTPLIDYNSYGIGTYNMSLVVTNKLGTESEEFSRIFYVVDDTTAPEVVATPVSSDWTNQPVEVKLEFSDKGGSEFKGYKYSITDSQATPTTWSDMILNESDSVTIGVEGEKYLHIIGYDNAGNVSEDRVLGPYKIDLTDPEIDSIVPENKDWTNESISINVEFSDEGGSGFSGYKYAITTSEDSPDTWSEIIQEDTAEFNITNEAEYYLHIITYDNAGNESAENVYGPYEVDKTSPEVEVTPAYSDWTNQPVEVSVNLSDEGGSKLQKYKYSITDSGIMPEEWEYEIEGEPETITVSKEGESYLHIIGYDNAGNDSSDNIFGKYKIDYTLPDLISDNEVNSDTELSSITFSAIDDASGVEKFIVNGTEIDGNQYTATINGEYEFEIWDNAGNVFVKNLTINNIFFECDQELEHPTYSSSYEKCPICELIDGINVTVEEKVYEGEPLGISYDNNKNAEIVEYYNGALDKPTLVGEYNYELKVVYNDAEHNTGINGILTINKKKLDIIGLKLEDKIYDGKLDVNIDKTNAAVEGIVDNDVDYVELEIPNVVSYDSLDRGNKTVALEKDIDYKLKLKDDVDSSYEVLIDCYNLPESIILSGKLIAGQYSITYENVNDADNSENLTSYTIENGKVELKDISRTGYTFTGWYTEKDCINKVTEIDCNDLEDKILYANWIANKYAITYNNCEDVTENQNPTEYTIEDEKIILKPAEKTGYIFKGWYTDETFTNAITEIEPTQLQNMQLYALWEEILYVKSDIYTIQEDESGANIYNVPKHTLVSKFLENIQTNATTVEIYYPHGVRLEDDKLIESGLTMIIQAGSQRKEFKIYLKEDSKIENNNSSSIIENKINTTENNFTTSKVIKDKISGILPYAGSENRAVILLAAVIVLVFDIIFKRVLNRKK